MNMKMARRIALAGLVAPVAIGLLAACSSGVAGRAGMADGPAAGITEHAVSSAIAPAPASAVVQTTAPGSVAASVPDVPASVPQQQAKVAVSDGSVGAINHGSNGSAAGAAGIGTQTGSASTPTQPAARFTSLGATESIDCWSGSAVTPILSWKTADATSVDVSVDHPGAVGEFGTFGKAGSISLPAVACTGSPGTAITHRYDVWALGSNTASHRVITLTTTVRIKMLPPIMTLSPKPKITMLPPMVVLTAKPTPKPKPIDPIFPPIPYPGP